MGVLSKAAVPAPRGSIQGKWIFHLLM